MEEVLKILSGINMKKPTTSPVSQTAKTKDKKVTLGVRHTVQYAYLQHRNLHLKPM